MGEKKTSVLAIGAGALLAGLGCAPLTPSLEAASQSQTAQTTEWRAARLAQALADAEAAHENGEQTRLAQLVSALTISGLAPRDEGSTDYVSQWSLATGGEAIPFRGRLLGPAYVRGELAPGEVWKSAQTFKSGEPSTLAVSHKGSGPVSLSVSDQSARSVCNAPGQKAPACRFTPLYTQRYSIELTNTGPGRAVYFLVFD
ncbi:hypothetical protein INR77_01175 [Erythrobacter sp. SCSIO 43205]|uniref:hypothetical protein n=1 Tax=Erythrobacter sp. SCSIO 43205 TaxID=2779361 RepID=UPI001CA94067|nr:hypothetical protein [Erythrobacter sp. SCSIO 43205]UAB78390.1 hypothetical protein INR77_01175 [Erythrobacter sp. SCSIO 43205]